MVKNARTPRSSWPGCAKNSRLKALILAAGSHNLSQIEPSETIPVFVRLANEMEAIEVVAISAESVSGNSYCGSTGHWPVPPGDSPDGTGSAPAANEGWPLGRNRLDLPVAES